MSDYKKNTKPQDSLRININKGYDVHYRTDTLGCAKIELLTGIEADDPRAAVKEFLNQINSY